MLRGLALVFLTPAGVILVVDIAARIARGEGPWLTALGEWWAWIHLDSLLLAQPAIQRHLSPALWDPVIQTLLEWPAALDFAVPGAALGLLHLWRRRRRRPAGG